MLKFKKQSPTSQHYPTGATTIVQLPLAFVRSGWINIDNGYANSAGSGGYSWSRTAISSTNARYLGMNTTDIGPSNSNRRWNGFSLR